VGSYLSIDLDYWLDHETRNSATNFFKKVLGLNVPVTFVIEHEELLNDINKMKKLTRMYNVDYHSDIVAKYDREDKPQDYEWANHVKRRTKAEFVWMMPNVKCFDQHLGCCHGEGDNPFLKNIDSGWRICRKKSGLRHIKLESVERVGVCLSPCFVTLYPVEEVLKMLNVSYYKATQLVQSQPWNATKRKRGILNRITV